jgi:hypothetical protein
MFFVNPLITLPNLSMDRDVGEYLRDEVRSRSFSSQRVQLTNPFPGNADYTT